MELLIMLIEVVHIHHISTLRALLNVPDTVGKVRVDLEGGELALAVVAGLECLHVVKIIEYSRVWEI